MARAQMEWIGAESAKKKSPDSNTLGFFVGILSSRRSLVLDLAVQVFGQTPCYSLISRPFNQSEHLIFHSGRRSQRWISKRESLAALD